MKENYRSHCPQNLALEIFGDKWTLLIIRDMMLAGKSRFREFLESREGIATNILTNRLRLLMEEGIVYFKTDPDHKQKKIYKLTQKGIDLYPILLANAHWSLKYQPVDKNDRLLAEELLSKNQTQHDQIITELIKRHLK